MTWAAGTELALAADNNIDLRAPITGSSPSSQLFLYSGHGAISQAAAAPKLDAALKGQGGGQNVATLAVTAAPAGHG